MTRKRLAATRPGTRTRKAVRRTAKAPAGAAAAGSTAVDRYIAAQTAPAQVVLTRVRRIIRRAVPRADEGISYGIPTFKLQGRPVLYFAAWKSHYSLYPSSTRLVAAFREELQPYTIRKGTIRFPFDRPVPVTLIAAIAKFRATEVGTDA